MKLLTFEIECKAGIQDARLLMSEMDIEVTTVYQHKCDLGRSTFYIRVPLPMGVEPLRSRIKEMVESGHTDFIHLHHIHESLKLI